MSLSRTVSRYSELQVENTPPRWGDPVEFRRDLRHQKTSVPGLSYDVVCVIL